MRVLKLEFVSRKQLIGIVLLLRKLNSYFPIRLKPLGWISSHDNNNPYGNVIKRIVKRVYQSFFPPLVSKQIITFEKGTLMFINVPTSRLLQLTRLKTYDYLPRVSRTASLNQLKPPRNTSV